MFLSVVVGGGDTEDDEIEMIVDACFAEVSSGWVVGSWELLEVGGNHRPIGKHHLVNCRVKSIGCYCPLIALGAALWCWGCQWTAEASSC